MPAIALLFGAVIFCMLLCRVFCRGVKNPNDAMYVTLKKGTYEVWNHTNYASYPTKISAIISYMENGVRKQFEFFAQIPDDIDLLCCISKEPKKQSMDPNGIPAEVYHCFFVYVKEKRSIMEKVMLIVRTVCCIIIVLNVTMLDYKLAKGYASIPLEDKDQNFSVFIMAFIISLFGCLLRVQRDSKLLRYVLIVVYILLMLYIFPIIAATVNELRDMFYLWG